MGRFKNILVVFFLIVCLVSVNARDWNADILGNGYEKTTLVMQNDYSGKVVSTVVRKRVKELSNKAVLYIHGYNDYFFQKEMGDTFVNHGYNFYAVDLRKYGRSILRHQRLFEVRNLNEYFADIDSALNVIKADGNIDIVLMGHSTGGLISSYYIEESRGVNQPIRALILNSPFLDMKLSKVQETYLLPLVAALSGVFPNIYINQESSDLYAQSLLKTYRGEWDYNVKWKLPLSPAVSFGWLGAIHQAQMKIQKGADIKIPILLMRSDKSVSGNSWSQDFKRGDAVLDVDEISMYGRQLGCEVQELVVKNGLHDLFLSCKPVREALYVYIFDWLDKNLN